MQGEKVAHGKKGALAVEEVYMEKPMGYHIPDGGKNLPDNVWKNPTQRKKIFDYCPEVSLIMDMKLERERCDGDNREGGIGPTDAEKEQAEKEAKQKAEEQAKAEEDERRKKEGEAEAARQAEEERKKQEEQQKQQEEQRKQQEEQQKQQQEQQKQEQQKQAEGDAQNKPADTKANGLDDLDENDLDEMLKLDYGLGGDGSSPSGPGSTDDADAKAKAMAEEAKAIAAAKESGSTQPL